MHVQWKIETDSEQFTTNLYLEEDVWYKQAEDELYLTRSPAGLLHDKCKYFRIKLMLPKMR